jgi:hypothetical protein
MILSSREVRLSWPSGSVLVKFAAKIMVRTGGDLPARTHVAKLRLDAFDIERDRRAPGEKEPDDARRGFGIWLESDRQKFKDRVGMVAADTLAAHALHALEM